MRIVRTVIALVMTALVASAITSIARAKELQKLDAKAATPGHVVIAGNGTTYVAWTHSGGTKADFAEFCRIPKGGKCKQPVKLPNPAGTDVTQSVAGAFPISGPGGQVVVVAPQYVQNDLVAWNSSDGGKTFDAGTILPGYSNKSNPSDAVVGPALFISADNPGLGFSESAGPTGDGFTFSAATGTVEGSSLAAADGSLFESYWTLGTKAKVRYFYWKASSGDPAIEAEWSGPADVANGYGGELAGGSGGVFIATQEYKGKKKYPTAVRVRTLTDSGSVGSPVTLVNDKKTDLFATGDIAEASNGHLAVIWPGYKKSGKLFMRAFTSKDGQKFSGPSNVAKLGGAYGIDDNAQLAYTNGGSGKFTFMNGSGLHLADLKSLK